MGEALKIGVVGCGEGTHGKVWAEMLCQPEHASLGMRVVSVWDENLSDAKDLAEKIGAAAVSDWREVAEGVDGLLITELYPDGYLELARPFLEQGRRIFFNRPFAGSMADAREIVRLARKHESPIYSASALFHTPAGEKAAGSALNFAPLKLYNMTGPTDHVWFYLPHAIAALLSVIGPGIRRVRTVSLPLRDDDPHLVSGPVVVYTEHESGAKGVIEMTGPGVDWYAFVLKLVGARGEMDEVRFEVTYLPLLEKMRDFFATGVEPIPHEVLLEKTAVFYAALESARRGGDVVEVRESTDGR